MEEKIYSDAYYSHRPCDDCTHNSFNNGEDMKGCRAFPNGIPDEAKCGHSHKHILPGQIGDFIFTEAKYEDLTPLAQYFWNIRHKK